MGHVTETNAIILVSHGKLSYRRNLPFAFDLAKLLEKQPKQWKRANFDLTAPKPHNRF